MNELQRVGRSVGPGMLERAPRRRGRGRRRPAVVRPGGLGHARVGRAGAAAADDRRPQRLAPVAHDQVRGQVPGDPTGAQRRRVRPQSRAGRQSSARSASARTRHHVMVRIASGTKDSDRRVDRGTPRQAPHRSVAAHPGAVRPARRGGGSYVRDADRRAGAGPAGARAGDPRPSRASSPVAVGGSLFGLLIIANAYVVGRSIGDVVVPAFAEGRRRRGELAAVAAVFIGIGVLGWPASSAAGSAPASCSSGCRPVPARGDPALPRAAAGLAPAARHRHAAVQRQLRRRGRLVPIAPLPFAVGTIVMLVAAVVALFFTDWVLALVGLAVFPALFGLNVVYSRRMSPRQIRAQQLRGRGQRGRARELRRRAGGQDDGPRGRGDRRGSPCASPSCATR